jgi:hypothetical protein
VFELAEMQEVDAVEELERGKWWKPWKSCKQWKKGILQLSPVRKLAKAQPLSVLSPFNYGTLELSVKICAGNAIRQGYVCERLAND